MFPMTAVLVLSLLSQAPEGPDSEIIDPSHPALRLLTETGGALLGGVAAYAAGYAIEWQLYCRPPIWEEDECVGPSTLFGLNVAVVGYGVGAWLGGKLGGSQAAWYAPLGGVLAGTGAAIAVMYVLHPLLPPANYVVGWEVYLGLTLAGAIVAAELSHAFELWLSRQQELSIAPVLGTDYRGVALTWRL